MIMRLETVLMLTVKVMMLIITLHRFQVSSSLLSSSLLSSSSLSSSLSSGASLAIAGSIRQLNGSIDSHDISRNASHDDDDDDDDDDNKSKKGWASMALYNTVPEANMQTDVNILREKMASFSTTHR